MNDVICNAKVQPFELEDLCVVPDDILAKSTTEKLQANMGKDIFSAILKTFGYHFAFYGLLEGTMAFTTFANPFALDILLQWMEAKGPAWQGYGLAVFFLLLWLVRERIECQYTYTERKLTQKVKGALNATIYDKVLKLSPQSKQRFTTGHLVSLMQTDSTKVHDYAFSVIAIITNAIQLTVGISLLWVKLGFAMIPGLLLIVLAIPITKFFTRKQKSATKRLMAEKDKRADLMSEVLNGIKAIKLYAWERAFKTQIEDVRSKECSILQNEAVLKAASALVESSLPFFVALFSFLTFIFMDSANVLSPRMTFVSLSLFTLISQPLDGLRYEFQKRASVSNLKSDTLVLIQKLLL